MPCVSSAGVFVVKSFRVVTRSAWYSGRRLTKQPRRLSMVQCSASPAKPQQSLSVAVIGAGAAGLVAARELVLEGHRVTVFEKGSSTGGVWVYTDEVEAPDLLGQDPERHKVHSSMYAQLRTNLPREVMAYTDFAFDDLAGQSKDSRRFPSHEEVLRCPEVKGSDVFPGQVTHSHNYRHNEAFKGQTVVLVGASASGEDICREIAEVADKVYLCARSWQNPAWATETVPFGHQHNIWRRPVPSSLAKDGSVTFSDGQRVERVDSVMYCTGYLYIFPFLDNIVSTADNRVAPVYRHIFPLSTAPTLSIIGLPWKVVPFPEFEVQAKWIARVLSKRVHLPSMDAMQAEVQRFYADLEQQEVPARYTHQLGDKQWAYKDWIAEQCGPDVAKTEPWRRKMYEATGQNKREFPDRYRDVWRDDDLVVQAKQAACKHSKELRAG
ncbi:hypothetical protein WJX79_000450 [Trebouxia sp. C0005]